MKPSKEVADLALKLWKIGWKARLKVNPYHRGYAWHEIPDYNKAGWYAVSAYALKMKGKP